MRKLLLVTAALLALTSVGNAAIIGDLGINPTSATGNFSAGAAQGVASGPFTADFTFTLTGGPKFVTIGSATNVFPAPTDFITNFAISVFAGTPGMGVLAFGPGLPSPCVFQPNCQVIAGSGILDPGAYFVEVTGIGGGTSGFGGNLASFAVPGPIVGAGLPGLMLALLGLVGLNRRRRNRA